MDRLLSKKRFIFLNSSMVIFMMLIISFVFVPFPVLAQTKYQYSYTGTYQEFECPKDGIYKIQLWGAQGGNYDATLFGGLGGYTEGIVKIKKGMKLYFYVGGQPSSSMTNYIGGWNGGGNVPTDKDEDGRAGGGATDVRTIKTSDSSVWNEKKSLASRIMVAAGGGGAAYEASDDWRSDGGAAGGLIGYIPENMGGDPNTTGIADSAVKNHGTGGRQEIGGFAKNDKNNSIGIGTFGKGGDGISNDGGSGGGGGWYGGGGSNICSGGGGGSSYISGHNGCIASTEAGEPINTEQIKSDQSYSWTKYVFANTKIIDGKGYLWTTEQGEAEEQPSPDGNGTQTGNSGNGYATIEFVRDLSEDNALSNLTASVGVLSPTFAEGIFEYDLVLEKEQRQVEITATPKTELTTVIGNGIYDIPYGEEKNIEVVVTSESGSIQIYQVHATRKKLDSSTHSSKLADLDIFDYDTKQKFSFDQVFESGKNDYTMTIGFSTTGIKVNAIAYDSLATVTVDGAELISGDNGVIKITVSEPNSTDTVYTITYTRETIEQDTFDYQGPGRFEFVAPASTWYKIQLWGAQGGQGRTNWTLKHPGGKGAYTEGEIFLEKGQELFFYIGGKGQAGGIPAGSAKLKCAGGAAGYNGGGKGANDSNCDSAPEPGGGGGGASDVRLVDAPGEEYWNDFESLKSRIMVAAGGGGGHFSYAGIAGGTQHGVIARGNYTYSYANQVDGYDFGVGQNGVSSSYGGGGSGGGYFGGYNGGTTTHGFGGSSFVSGCYQCIAINKASTPGNIILSNSNVHYSGFYFDHILMLSGIDQQFSENGDPMGIGNPGDGYGKISVAKSRSNNNYLSSLTTSNGTLSPSFSPTVQKYDLELDSESGEVDLSATLADINSAVGGLGKYKVEYGKNKKVNISVTNQLGDVRVYEIDIHRKELASGEHSSKIANLTFKLDSEEDVMPTLSPAFHSDVLEYSIEIPSNLLVLDFNIVTFDQDAVVKKEGVDQVLGVSGTFTITVSAPNCTDTIYTINYKRRSISRDATNYEPTGSYQTFIAPANGKYKVELWGSQGQNENCGKGAYTKGEIFLEKDEKLYVYVGDNKAISFNGGTSSYAYGGDGGGATDVRLISGEWDDFNSLKSRIMVAAGGGGSSSYDQKGSSISYGGAAGGLFSYDVPYVAKGDWVLSLNTGATQKNGGFGFITYANSYGSQNGQFGIASYGPFDGFGGGAGGGYYGGAGGGTGDYITISGSGGSSYISGHIGSNSILEHSTKEHIFHSGSEIHYSGKFFTNTEMIDGLGYSWVDAKGPDYTPASENGDGERAILLSKYTGQPTTDMGAIVDGHTGEGYARITPIFPPSNNNYLTSLTSDVGTLSPKFSPSTSMYDLILDKEERIVHLSAEASDPSSFVAGLGKYEVRYLEGQKVDIVVTSESGDVRVYTVNIKRKEMSSDEHSSKIADLDFVVAGNDVEPRFEPDFQSNILEYDITLPSNMLMLDVNAVLFDSEATMAKEGTGLIVSKEGTIKLTVSEPHCSDTVYLIHYTKVDSIAEKYEFYATDDYQVFTAPVRGRYRFELWGSQGSNMGIHAGGKGAYTKGDIILDKDEKVYLYVGNSKGEKKSFNGGGSGGSSASGGGGATDVRLVPGTWNDFSSLKSRIMVAAGGGGVTIWKKGSEGGAAGGLFSYDTPYYASGNWGNTLGTGATQTIGGAGFDSILGAPYHGGNGQFGIAGNGSDNEYGGGGGSGYYGGSGGGDGDFAVSSGSGGSSYISGHIGCNSIKESSRQNNISHTGDNIHYSKKYFTNTEMIDGLGYRWTNTIGPSYTDVTNNGGHVVLDDGEYTGQPTNDGTDIQDGQSGDGYAKITPLFESNNNYLVDLKSNYGKFTQKFDPLVTDYTLVLDKYEQHFTLSGILADSNATVIGLDTKYEVALGATRVVNIVITAPDGATRTYQVVATRGDFLEGEHSTKLKDIILNQGSYRLEPDFISIREKYELQAPYSSIAVSVDAIAYDSEATIKVEGNGYIKGNNNIIKITVTHPGVETTVYEIKVSKEELIEGQKWEYACTNSYQEFVAPASTYYKMQLWGARGGYGRRDWVLKYRGGHGAYTEGEIYLKKGKKVYVYVGCQGQDGGTSSKFIGGSGGWNGGAKGGNDSNKDSRPEPAGGGGGATDIRLTPTSVKTEWDDFNSLKSRIMVAAAGGGGCYSGIGGAGGTLEGTTGYGNKSIPTQTSGYGFGYGMIGKNNTAGSGGGAGGYFGGYSTPSNAYHGGGGGSSFISGCDGCVAIDQSSTSETDLTSSNSNKHYSGFVYDKIKMYSGGESQPSPSGGYQTGNAGDGYTIITAAKNRSENNFLSEITVDKGELTPQYDMLTKEYYVLLDANTDSITIDAKTDDEKAVLSGTGVFDVKAGKNSFVITVTAENGDVRIYTVVVERPKSNNPYPFNITVSGLIPNLCSVNSAYCNLTPGFNPDTVSYSMTVPSRLTKIEFVVAKGNKYQTVIGDGEVSLEPGMNTFTIEVISEDGEATASYTFSINRDMSGDANISKLEVLDPQTDIHFQPEKLDYSFSIPNTYTSLTLDIELQDAEATYKVIGNQNFEVGLNLVQIEVTAQNNEKKTYVLNVYREQNGNTFLSDIKVKHDGVIYPLVPTYNKLYHSYLVQVPGDISKATIEVVPEHSLTQVVGDGEKSLVSGTNTFTIGVTAEDGSTNTYTISIVREKGSDATLKSLDVLEGSLSPEFKSDQEVYDIEVSAGVDSLTLNPVLNDSNAKYRVTGNGNFKTGKNVVYITVTAEDGTTKTYVINVMKKANDNNYLSSLELDQYDLSTEFNKEMENYYIDLDRSITQIEVSATPEDSKAKVSNTGIYNLKVGYNQIDVLVTSQSGLVRTYTLHITVNANSNSNLLSLTTSSIVSYIPNFKANITEYTLEVPHDEDKITVLGVSEDQYASVSGNGTYHLNIGDNVISIVVTAENKFTTTYHLNVHRKASDNANLSLLIAKESVLDPEFDPDILAYDLRVLEAVTELTLYINTEDKNATYEVIDNGNFQLGNNTVIVRVTAEDGVTTKDYTLNVLRQEVGTASNYLNNLTVSEGSLDPEFNRDITYYEVEVLYEVDQVALDGELDDKNATVSGFQNYPLKVGKNTLAVSVTSTEGIVRYYQVVVTRKGKSEARLSKLEVLDHLYSPSFDQDTFEYTLTTTLDELEITAETLDSNATYEVIGNENFELGDNQVIIRVTAEDGVTTQDYILNVTKQKSNNNNLKSLTVNGTTYTPDFSKTTTVYTAIVARNVNTLQITALPEDIRSTVSGDGEINLSLGINYIDIVVTSEAGTKKTYTLVVTRQAETNNYLSSLIPSYGSLNETFNKELNHYTMTVPYEVEDIVISGTPEDVNATVLGFDRYKLEVGDNQIQIVVTAENGISNVYTLTVTRENIVSSLLEKLSIKDYQMDQKFASEVFDYTVTVDYEVEDLILDIKTLDQNATYEVVGNSNFVVGMNTVEIIVTDSLGESTTTYTLNVNRQNYANTFLAYIYTNHGNLDPLFQKEVLSYEVVVDSDIDSINIMAEPEVLTNKLTGDGTYSLLPGDNLFDLTVETPEGMKRTYFVNVIRKQDDCNDLTSLIVNANDEEQTLNPTFDQDTLAYEVTVSPSTPSIEILATTTNKASISGIGTRPLTVGENIFNVVVTSESGLSKVYEITVNRKASDNNYLSTLVPSFGTLDPVFYEQGQEYTLVVDSSVSTLSFATTTKDQFAIVTGNETQIIPDGESLREIVVTAENGDIRTYKIKVIKERSDEARLSELKIPNYPFEEEFDQDTFNYTVTLPRGKTELVADDVIAIPVDNKATVTKLEKLELSSEKDNIYTVEVTARDGFTKQIYRIKVNLVTDINITDIILDDYLVLEVGEIIELEPVFEPVDATNKEVEYVSGDSSIVTVDNGVVTGIKEGETTIVVTSKVNKDVSKTIKVSVLNLRITSDIYDVRRDGVLYPYIIGAEQGEKFSEFITKLNNQEELIHFYYADGTEITDLDGEQIRTGAYITIEFKDKVYDQVYIAVRGDVNGDGEINIKDYNKAVNHTLKKEILEHYWFVVANVDEEDAGIINVKDSNKIQNKILKKITSLNP